MGLTAVATSCFEYQIGLWVKFQVTAYNLSWNPMSWLVDPVVGRVCPRSCHMRNGYGAGFSGEIGHVWGAPFVPPACEGGVLFFQIQRSCARHFGIRDLTDGPVAFLQQSRANLQPRCSCSCAYTTSRAYKVLLNVESWQVLLCGSVS